MEGMNPQGIISCVLKLELGNIELLVREIIGLATTKTIIEEEFEVLRQAVLVEAKRIENSLQEQFLSADKETILRKFFRYHATSLVSILDDIPDSSRVLEADTMNSFAISFVYSTVENLLSFIRNLVPQYWMEGIVAPKRFSESILTEIEGSTENLLFTLSKSGIDDKTRELIVLTFQMQPKNISYERLLFLQLLQSELSRIEWSDSNPERVKQRFIDTLIKLNFNEPSFVGYYSEHVTDALKGCETLVDRIDQLGYLFKLMNQAYVRPGIIYNPSMAGIKEQLLELLANELDYYQLKRQLNLTASKGDLLIKNDFKLIFDMSVANLAFLFKLFIETGIIQNKNASEVIRFLTKFVKTKKSETVSYESFRIKYYNIESGTKDAVKKTLQSLLNFISKN